MNTELNTPTPRTDDAQWGTGKVTTDFARTLERELAAASQAYECAMAIHGTVMEERDRLAAALTAEREKSERYRLTTLKLDAELATERARMKKIETALKDAISTAQDRNVSHRLERDKAEAEYQRACEVEQELRAEVKRMTHAYEYDHKCLYEVRGRCELWKQRAIKAEAELAKYLSACPASPTEEERKRCQQWWSISGRAS
jgi:hypothetical protein